MSRPRHPPSHLGSEFIMTARRFFIGFWMLLAVAGLGNVEPVQAATTGDDAAAIRQVMDQAQAAWNRGDVADYMRCYKDAPDTTFVGSSVRKGYQAIDRKSTRLNSSH